MKKIVVDNEITLVPYYPSYKTTINWYLDKDICKQVDNIDYVYDLNLLKSMYKYLNKNGYLYYIKYKSKLCGDVSLQFNGDVAIVISKQYQNKHIGTKVMKKIIKIAKELNYDKIKAHIYEFNKQSQKMFINVGFVKIDNENYVYLIEK